MPGQRVGKFEILGEVGRGGFGVVYEARDVELGRSVAFKALRPGAGARVDTSLLAEAEVAARFSHPNIVQLHDYGRWEGGGFLILELLRGEPLSARLARGRLPLREAVRIARDVALALAHAHAKGVVHRDLKPGNVFLAEDGTVKVLDFGLALVLGRSSSWGATPAYASPEQMRGEPGTHAATFSRSG
jgi:serine/threonine protein kinase